MHHNARQCIHKRTNPLGAVSDIWSIESDCMTYGAFCVIAVHWDWLWMSIECTQMHFNAYRVWQCMRHFVMGALSLIAWHMEHYVSLLFIETDCECQWRVHPMHEEMHTVEDASNAYNVFECKVILMSVHAYKFNQCTKGIECMNAHQTSEFRWMHAGLLIVKNNVFNALQCAMHVMHCAAHGTRSMHWMHLGALHWIDNAL